MAIRPFNLLDVTRLARGGSRPTVDRARTLSDLSVEARPSPSMSDILRTTVALQSGGYRSLTSTDGGRVFAVAAARPRSSPESYEVAHMLAGEVDSSHVDLLRELCGEVAAGGGQKIFFRLDADDELVELAGRCGLIRYQYELLYRGTHRVRGHAERVRLRRRRPADEHGVFQLYCASTPARVRSMVGLTLSLWAGARERRGRRTREMVCETDGAITAWVSVSRGAGAVQVEMMVHPSRQEYTGGLLEAGLARVRPGRTVYALVPEHQVLLRRLLEQNGYQQVREFTALARSMVVPVAEELVSDAIGVPSV